MYFNFLIVNFPFIYSNIPAASTYGVYICGSYKNFLNRVLLLKMKILNQGFLVVKLKFLHQHYDMLTITKYVFTNFIWNFKIKRILTVSNIISKEAVIFNEKYVLFCLYAYSCIVCSCFVSPLYTLALAAKLNVIMFFNVHYTKSCQKFSNWS